MRLSIVCTYDALNQNYTGGLLYNNLVLRRLVSRGHLVRSVPGYSGRRWFAPLWSLAALRQINEACPGQCLVFAPMAQRHLFALVAGQLSTAQRKLVVIVHDLSQVGFTGAKKLLDDLAVRSLARAADLIIAVSESQKQRLVTQGVAHDRVRVIHGSSNPELAHLAPTSPPSLGSGRSFRFLLVGRTIPRKGIAWLIRALAMLGGDRAAVRIVGSRPEDEWHRRSLEKLARDLGVHHRVQFAPFVASPAALAQEFRAADCFVLPSLGEGYPLVILEAMLFWLPIIATNVDGIPEQIEHGESGLLVPPGEAEPLAAAMERVMTDRELRLRLQVGARKRYEQIAHSWDEIADEFEREFLRLWRTMDR